MVKMLRFIRALKRKKNEIESVEKNISSMIYKLAVEQAITNNIVACYNVVNDETVRERKGAEFVPAVYVRFAMEGSIYRSTYFNYFFQIY